MVLKFLSWRAPFTAPKAISPPTDLSVFFSLFGNMYSFVTALSEMQQCALYQMVIEYNKSTPEFKTQTFIFAVHKKLHINILQTEVYLF